MICGGHQLLKYRVSGRPVKLAPARGRRARLPRPARGLGRWPSTSARFGATPVHPAGALCGRPELAVSARPLAAGSRAAPAGCSRGGFAWALVNNSRRLDRRGCYLVALTTFARLPISWTPSCRNETAGRRRRQHATEPAARGAYLI
jgi:hypothetical protein